MNWIIDLEPSILGIRAIELAKHEQLSATHKGEYE